MSKYDKVNFSPTAKLPLADKLIWCAGSGMGTNVSWVCFGYYLLFFYTDIMGISATIAGSIMLFARIFDAVTDVVMGWAVDRFNFKWGKYRSWIIFALFPMTLLNIGVFTCIPGLGMTAKIVWATITYGCFGAVGATLVFIPMSSQLMNMTKNVEERASMAGLKTVFNNVSQIIVSSLFMPLIMLCGGKNGNMSGGFFWATTLLALLVLVLLLGVVQVTKKYELNEDGSPREHLRVTEHEPLLGQIKDVLTNRPAVVLVIGIIVQYILQAVRSGMVIYIFNYYFVLPDFLPIAMFVNTGAAVVGALLLKPSIHFLKDSNRAFLTVMGLSIIGNVAFWGVAKGMGGQGAASSIQFGLLFFLFAFNGLMMGMHYAFMNVLLPNVIEYGAWKTGKYQPGMIYGLNAICLTLGGAFGGQITGLLLNSSGYIANAAQSPETLSKLLFIAFMVPSILTLAQFIIQCFFGLSDKQCNEYVVEMQNRVKGAAQK